MSIRNERLHILGMRCAGCETILEDALRLEAGIHGVKASHTGGKLEVSFEPEALRLSRILALIEEQGYDVTFAGDESPALAKYAKGARKALTLVALLLIIGGITFWGRTLIPGVMTQISDPMTGYAMILLVGFLTGFHCIGMCGSFVVSYATAPGTGGHSGKALRHASYSLGKIISYATLGALFGALGALVSITPFMQGGLGIAAGLFLALYGLRMLNVWSGPSWLNWVFPKFVTRNVRSGMQQQPRPFVLGLFNGFLLGCGPLQAMYIMAAGTGSPYQGALLLTFFCLGTLGPLLTLGFFADRLSRRVMGDLVKVSGILVLSMGLMMANKGLQLTESGFDAEGLGARWHMLMMKIQNPHGDAPCH
ncbi:MAG: sulfite exporter TauE/SafE family protein [Methylococcus sp.]